MSRCIVVGISGASGSGKTMLAERLVRGLRESFGAESVGVICEDYYYNNQDHVSPADRVNVNYDHPDSLDHALMVEQLIALKDGKTVDLPQYNYTKHTRAAETVRMEPKRVIVVEGILLFTDPALRKEMHYLIFVDTPLDMCLIRRAKRDMAERSRTFESVVAQYEATVRPMYLQFIEPSRRWADVIVPSWKDNSVAVEVLQSKISEHLR